MLLGKLKSTNIKTLGGESPPVRTLDTLARAVDQSIPPFVQEEAHVRSESDIFNGGQNPIKS